MNHEYLRHYKFVVVRPDMPALEADVYAYGQGQASDILNQLFPSMVGCVCINPSRIESESVSEDIITI